jgi:hypothetical protein
MASTNAQTIEKKWITYLTSNGILSGMAVKAKQKQLDTSVPWILTAFDCNYYFFVAEHDPSSPRRFLEDACWITRNNC